MEEINKTDDTKLKAVQKTEATKQKKNIKRLSIFVAITLLLIGWLIISSASGPKGAIGTADRVITDLQAGRCEDMFQNASEEFKNKGPKENWDESCKQVSRILQGDPVQRAVVEPSSPEAVQKTEVTYVIDGTDGEKYRVKVAVINQDNTWLLTSFDSNGLTEEEITELNN